MNETNTDFKALSAIDKLIQKRITYNEMLRIMKQDFKNSKWKGCEIGNKKTLQKN